MEVNSSLYNLEFISESMEQKDRGSLCCTGELMCILTRCFSPFTACCRKACFLTPLKIISNDRDKKYFKVYSFELSSPDIRL